MELKTIRYSSAKRDTLSLFLIDCEFMCYVLEDEHRNEKVFGETRIPAGVYEVKFRKEGGFHNRYTAKYGETFHKGMLELQDVPNFKYVLIHIGNDEDDTAGCLLVGNTANNNQVKNGFVGSSTQAYKSIYPRIAKALEEGEQVWLTIEEI